MGSAARPVLRRTCYAIDCERTLDRSLVFCPDHWFSLSREARVRIHNERERWLAGRGEATPEWRKAIAAAVVVVAEREGRDVPELFRRMALDGLAVGA